MNKAEYQTYLASREWALLREAVRRRSGGFCERCRRRPQEAVHHLTYERVGRELLTDLQAICDPCHEFLSGKRHDDPAAIAPVDWQSPAEQPENRAGPGLVEKWLHRDQPATTEDEEADEEEDEEPTDEELLEIIGRYLVEKYHADMAYLEPEALVDACMRSGYCRGTYEQTVAKLIEEDDLEGLVAGLEEWAEEELREYYADWKPTSDRPPLKTPGEPF